ncbi:MAG: hypothetical protein N2593_01830 [Patescibacteria group bacterium]|nr:hypothetical protein [Patescibacteria group bacterium]
MYQNPNKPNNLSELVGKTITINPQALLNRGRLFTTQKYIDIYDPYLQKIKRAIGDMSDVKIDNGLPIVWVAEQNGEITYIVGEGNHRIAMACINRSIIDVCVTGIFDGKKSIFGFNIIVKKMREFLADQK